MSRGLISICLVFGILAGCNSGASQTQSPTATFQPAPLATTEITLPAPTLELVTSSEPQRIEFQTEDGIKLVGTFWPPAADQAPAPGILLMHWNPGSRGDWMLLGGLLQGTAIAGTNRRSHAAFAFDFRGHGESEGDQDRSGYLADARAALTLFRTLPGVNPSQIILIGASIGADAAVDVCGEGCLGAVSISPGGFLNVPYTDALNELDNKPVLCVASEDDTPSSQVCKAGEGLGLSNFQTQLYQGSAHGMTIFDQTEQVPSLMDLLFNWLEEQLAGQ